MWPQVSILLWFLGGLLVLCGIVPLIAILGGMNDCADDGDDIGLGEDAGVPAASDLRAARTRAHEQLRTGAAVAALRLRARNRRDERRAVEPFLCGTPTLDLDALEDAVDAHNTGRLERRVRRVLEIHARELGGDALSADRLREQIDILKELRGADHLIAIAEQVAAADRLKQSAQRCSKDVA